jgi:hypothetical protein
MEMLMLEPVWPDPILVCTADKERNPAPQLFMLAVGAVHSIKTKCNSRLFLAVEWRC